MGSAWTVVPASPQMRTARASGFRADIANLLYQPKENAFLTFPAATSELPWSPKARALSDRAGKEALRFERCLGVVRREVNRNAAENSNSHARPTASV